MLELKDLEQLPQFWEWKEEQQKGAKTTLLISILIDIIFGLFIILNLVNFNFAKEIMLAVMIILTLLKLIVNRNRLLFCQKHIRKINI